MADNPRREPRKVQVTLALDKLVQRGIQGRRITAAHQVFSQHPRGVRQRGIGAGLEGLNGRARVEIVQLGARERFAEFTVHYGTRSRSVRNAGEELFSGSPAPFSALFDRHEAALFDADVFGTRANDAVIGALLENVSGPAGQA